MRRELTRILKPSFLTTSFIPPPFFSPSSLLSVYRRSSIYSLYLSYTSTPLAARFSNFLTRHPARLAKPQYQVRRALTTTTATMASATQMDFYSYKPLDKKGEPFDMAQLKGKVVLIVNV